MVSGHAKAADPVTCNPASLKSSSANSVLKFIQYLIDPETLKASQGNIELLEL